MNDEIKEILDNLDKIAKAEYYPEDLLTYKECQLLLDYITNLQEQLHQASLDIQELTEKDIGCPSWCDKLTNLQEEKIQLEGKIKQLEHNCKQASDSCRQHRLASKNHIRRLERREQQINIYKSRCEEAIEKLESIRAFGLRSGKTLFSTIINETIDILNGDDEE